MKPLGLKKPLIAYIIFNALFTVNISQQVAENAKIFLNLMKKYYLFYSGLSKLILSWKLCLIFSISSWRPTKRKISRNFFQRSCIMWSKKGCSVRSSSKPGTKAKSLRSRRTSSITPIGIVTSRKQSFPIWNLWRMKKMRRMKLCDSNVNVLMYSVSIEVSISRESGLC